MSNTAIPFLNLKDQYIQLKPSIDQAIQAVLDKGDYVKGAAVTDFEQNFAQYLNAKHCVGVANGTDALIIALKALNIGYGDEVITVPNTFIATVEAIVAVGATPVLSAIDEPTYTMDTSQLEVAITPKTKAIIPVHLYGMPCDMEPINQIAKKHNLKVICDAAQAHGAEYKGKPLVEYCDAITYSFYPGKNLGCYGDGGAIVTNDEALYLIMKALADHGRLEKYTHQFYGLNSRLDTIQAAILNVKLLYLTEWNERRRAIAEQYTQGLKDIEAIICPTVPAYAAPVWHLYVIRTAKRDELQNYLKEQGIQTGIHYPIAVHDQQAAQGIKCCCDTQSTTEMSRQYLSLPMCPYMTDEMVERVIKRIVKFK